MNKIRIIIFLLLIIVGIYCLVPIILLLTGVYNTNSLFKRPPSAVLTALHCDHNLKNDDGFSAMRLTTVVSTHNMEGKDVKIQAKFLYEDGTPVLSNNGEIPIEITKQIKAFSNDTVLNIILNAEYRIFPKESFNKLIECIIYLSYEDWENSIVLKEQNKTIKFRVNHSTIKNINVDHNIEKDGTKGMQIAVEFESKNLKDEALYCMVRFYNEDGSPLVQQSNNKKYRSVNGNVIVGEYTSPTHDDCKTKTTLFIPYKELPQNTGGRTDLILDASILHYTTTTDYEVLDRSKTYSFYLTND